MDIIKILDQIKASILKTYKLFKSNEQEIRKRFYEIVKDKSENNNEQVKKDVQDQLKRLPKLESKNKRLAKLLKEI